MSALDSQEVTEALKSLPNWHLENAKLVRDFTFSDFVQALAFINEVGTLAEAHNHHPDIDLRYNQVKLALTSHDANGITRRDVKLATVLDSTFPENRNK